MVGYKDTSDVPKKAADVAQKKKKARTGPPIVSFIHNGSEIITWMGHSFKTKSIISRATFLR